MSGSDRADIAAEMLTDLDEGFHYATLGFDEDRRVVEVAWNYDREAGQPYQNDDFTDPQETERRRELAIGYQEQYEDDEPRKTTQTKLVTDGGTNGSERLIGYTVGDLDSGFEDVCLDCIDDWDDSIPRHSITDSETYGDVVPYPECAGCGDFLEVAVPGNEAGEAE